LGVRAGTPGGLEAMGLSPLVVWVDEGRCSGCHECLKVCRYSALNWVPGEQAVWPDPWQCNGCGSCQTVCPNDALRLENRSGVTAWSDAT